MTNQKWVIDPHDYFIPNSHPRKTRLWENKLEPLNKRGLVVVFNDVEYLSTEGFLCIVMQDKQLSALIPYAISMYDQEQVSKGIPKIVVNPLGNLQSNHDPYLTRRHDPVRNRTTRIQRSMKHSPTKNKEQGHNPTHSENSNAEISIGESRHRRTIHTRPLDSPGYISASISFLNRKVLSSILEIYNVFPEDDTIQRPESLYDAMVLCMKTFMKARFYGFTFRDMNSAELNMKDILDKIMEFKELQGPVVRGKQTMMNKLEKVLTGDSQRAAELFILSDMSVTKWRLLRSCLSHKYTPISNCTLPTTIDEIPLPALWPSYYKVQEGMKDIDKFIPRYQRLTNLPNNGQLGYRFTRDDFSLALHTILSSKQKLHFECHDFTLPLASYNQHLTQAGNMLTNSVTISGDSVTLMDTKQLKLLFCGDGYRDMQFASEDFRKSKIACFGILENFVEGSALQLFANAWLLLFDEGNEEDTTVRAYCQEIFSIFEDFSRNGFLYRDPVSGSFSLFTFEVSFVADYKFLCLLLGLHLKDCWRCHGAIDSWFEPAPSRTLAELIENYNTDRNMQKYLPISEFFPLEAYHCDPVHFSSATGRALMADITTSAIQHDNAVVNKTVKQHPVYLFFRHPDRTEPTEREYTEFLQLFTKTPAQTDRLKEACRVKWQAIHDDDGFSKNQSPSLMAIQQLFSTLRCGISLVGLENSGKKMKNVLGWHTAIILALMPEIAVVIGMSDDSRQRYNAMRKFLKIIHKRTLKEKHRKDVRELYLRAFKGYEFMKKKTYVKLGWHFVDEIEKGATPGRKTCQRNERGNCEMKRMRMNHSNNRIPVNVVADTGNDDDIEDSILPHDVLYSIGIDVHKNGPSGEDYIYQTLRNYNRKQWVYSNYGIRNTVNQSDRLKSVLNRMKVGNYRQFGQHEDRLNEKDVMKLSVIQSDSVIIRTKGDKPQHIIDLKMCNSIESFSKFRPQWSI